MATYYVDGATGNDGNTGGSGDPWATIDKAMNTVAAADTVFVKSSATYAETATIDTAGTTSAPILFVGYTTTADRTDRGKVTIDATGLTNALADSLGAVGGYYVFENFKFTNANADGVNLSLNQMTFRNCEFNDNTTDGLAMGNGPMCESCIFSGNGGKGIDCGTVLQVFGCRFLSNTDDGIECTFGTVWGSVFYNNGGDAIEFLGSNGFGSAVINCTIDGNAKTTGAGIDFATSFWGPYAAINCIIYDCTTGITGHNNGGGRFIGRNNLLNNNTSNYGSGYETLVGEVTSAPSFTDEGSQDYTLGGLSPALNVGFDGYETAGASQLADIGAHESSAAAGGGLLQGNKRGHKQ